jgi:hypothetical protein
LEITATTIALVVNEFDILCENHSNVKIHFLIAQCIDNDNSDQTIENLLNQIPDDYECPFTTEIDYRDKLESFIIYFSPEMERLIKLETKKDRKVFRFKKEIIKRREKLLELLKDVAQWLEV